MAAQKVKLGKKQFTLSPVTFGQVQGFVQRLADLVVNIQGFLEAVAHAALQGGEHKEAVGKMMAGFPDVIRLLLTETLGCTAKDVDNATPHEVMVALRQVGEINHIWELIGEAKKVAALRMAPAQRAAAEAPRKP